MEKEIIDHVKKLKDQGADVKVDEDQINVRKNIFACLFSVHNTISLSRHEQVCLFVHDVINLLYYQINDLINKIFNKKYEKYEIKRCIDSEIDKFLEKYGGKNISISYDKIKINLIQKKLLNHSKNYVIN